MLMALSLNSAKEPSAQVKSLIIHAKETEDEPVRISGEGNFLSAKRHV
jgi:hypothetical protein